MRCARCNADSVGTETHQRTATEVFTTLVMVAMPIRSGQRLSHDNLKSATDAFLRCNADSVGTETLTNNSSMQIHFQTRCNADSVGTETLTTRALATRSDRTAVAMPIRSGQRLSQRSELDRQLSSSLQCRFGRDRDSHNWNLNRERDDAHVVAMPIRSGQRLSHRSKLNMMIRGFGSLQCRFGRDRDSHG